LGTGTSQGVPVIGCKCAVCTSTNPKDNRTRTSLLISSATTNIVIDTGPDFRQQILDAKINHLDAVLFTHEHNDHVAGLDDVRPFYFTQKKDIPIFGLPRVINDIKNRFAYSFDENPYPGTASFQVMEMPKEDILFIGDIKVELLHIIHGDLPILGYKIGNIAYITDVSEIPLAAENLIKECDILILDALHHNAHHSHFNLKQALDFIQKVQPKQAYLIHISHHMGLHDIVNATLPFNVQLGYDGLEIWIEN
jgi:phosphoribosyl 1,2-cyclic phosphate phosphodiesterase